MPLKLNLYIYVGNLKDVNNIVKLEVLLAFEILKMK